MSKIFDYYGITFKKGDIVFKEGDEADALFMIKKGSVEIRKGIGHGDEKIYTLGEGEFIGEMAVIDEMPRSATAIAIEDCELIRMDKESFDKTIRGNLDFAVNVIQFLSRRLRETDELVMVFAKMDRRQKVLAEMLEDMITHGKRDKRGEWYLLNQDDFIHRVGKKTSWDVPMIKAVINELLLIKKIEVKKDQSGKDWLAYRIREAQ